MKIKLNDREQTIELRSESPGDAFQMGVILPAIKESSQYGRAAREVLTIPVAACCGLYWSASHEAR
jgi:hypothetical protein